MRRSLLYKTLNFSIAMIWLINGLYCKVLGQVSRHKEIVARILGTEYAGIATLTIGICEILMAIWIFWGIKSRLNALVQIVLIAIMNTIEFFLAHDLLLFGYVNAILALTLIITIYYKEFILTHPTCR